MRRSSGATCTRSKFNNTAVNSRELISNNEMITRAALRRVILRIPIAQLKSPRPMAIAAKWSHFSRLSIEGDDTTDLISCDIIVQNTASRRSKIPITRFAMVVN